MEPYIPTSFIPKRPIDAAMPVGANGKKKPFGFLSLLIFIIIIGTVGAYVGVTFYQSTLTQQKQKLEADLAAARDGIGTDFVSDMSRLDQRITGVKTLLDDHVVVTPIFQAIEATTLRSVQYTNFQYVLERNASNQVTTVKVTLKGVAKSYATIALQSDAFLGSSIIKNPVFADLAVDDKNKINFNLTFDVDAQSLSYETFIASLVPAAPAAIVAPVTNPTQ